jgi:hypothetical protein
MLATSGAVCERLGDGRLQVWLWADLDDRTRAELTRALPDFRFSDLEFPVLRLAMAGERLHGRWYLASDGMVYAGRPPGPASRGHYANRWNRLRCKLLRRHRDTSRSHFVMRRVGDAPYFECRNCGGLMQPTR